MDNGTGETMAHALTIGVDVGIYGRLATRDHILELAELAEASGVTARQLGSGLISGCACAKGCRFSC
jgi:hypothetical protein